MLGRNNNHNSHVSVNQIITRGVELLNNGLSVNALSSRLKVEYDLTGLLAGEMAAAAIKRWERNHPQEPK